MPSSRRARNQETSPSSIPAVPFTFPRENHLLITTPRNIFAWDAAGVQTVFQSRRGGIVAAQEAPDGSGVLAIASKDVVVLHDTKRGQESSWGLNADEDTVRHLNYTQDAKSIYMSTGSAGAIQHYSTEQARLLTPAQSLASPPTALAISCTGHLMLSASDNPPAVYVNSLAHNSPPTLLLPDASSAAVSFASFHPERPNVFLLAFRDATVAAYDATRLSRRIAEPTRGYLGVADGELGHFQTLHRGTMIREDLSPVAPIVGAAFLPGFKTRAVTAGCDGRCRIVDFAKGGVVLRTWHALASLTGVSVLSLKKDREVPEARTSSHHGQLARSHTIGGPTSTNNLIAVSRIDGRVIIHDSVGRLVAQKTVSSAEEKILSIEWVKGSSPRVFSSTGIARRFSNATPITLTSSSRKRNDASVASSKKMPRPKIHPTNSNLGLPASLSRPQEPPMTSAVRKFTIHPDEIDAGTVRIIPSPKRAPLPVGVLEYQDLFSPVKPVEKAVIESPPKLRVTSPPRSRPRISSQTFVRDPTQDVDHRAIAASVPDPVAPLRPARRTATNISPRQSQRDISKSKPNALRSGGFSTSSDRLASTTSSRPNAKILSDIRSLASHDGALQLKQGTLSLYAPSQRSAKQPASLRETGIPQMLRSAPSADPHRQKHIHVNHRSTWPTDSSEATSLEDAGDDIWLTSESDVSTFVRRKRTIKSSLRPYVPTQRANADRRNDVLAVGRGSRGPSYPPRAVDGSMEEGALSPHETSMSRNDTFSPASEDVRQLFPRTSSLSPHKKRRSPKKSPKPRVPSRGNNSSLTRMALGVTQGRQPKSPWERAKASKVPDKPIAASAVEDQENATPPDPFDGLVRSPSTLCLTCPETTARVQVLENEVAHLKGEVLALKATLRRSGIAIPNSLR